MRSFFYYLRGVFGVAKETFGQPKFSPILVFSFRSPTFAVFEFLARWVPIFVNFGNFVSTKCFLSFENLYLFQFRTVGNLRIKNFFSADNRRKLRIIFEVHLFIASVDLLIIQKNNWTARELVIKKLVFSVKHVVGEKNRVASFVRKTFSA